MTNGVSQKSGEVVRLHSTTSYIALAIAIVAVVVPDPFRMLVALLAIAAALVSRNELRRDPELHGTWASLGAFLIGAGCLVVSAFPWVVAFLLSLMTL